MHTRANECANHVRRHQRLPGTARGNGPRRWTSNIVRRHGRERGALLRVRPHALRKRLRHIQRQLPVYVVGLHLDTAAAAGICVQRHKRRIKLATGGVR